MTILSEEFRGTMALWASGVTVVTSADRGQLQGMTVSSFGSVSLDPPLISVGIAQSARFLEACRRSGAFAVNVLAEDQRQVSNHFASKLEAGRLEGQSYTLDSRGCPLLRGALAQLECSVFAIYPAGDHELVVGLVERSSIQKKSPLLYFAGGYGRFTSSE